MKTLFLLYLAGYIDLYFGDESGFSLTPNIPYGWQPTGQQSPIPTERKHVFNVFALLDPVGQVVHPYATAKGQKIDSGFMVDCITEFLGHCRKPTVVVLDNAPWHTSEAFKANIGEWEEKGLYIFYLPKYSPHLNPIETLWRKIKYEWLRPSDYRSTGTLKKRIKEIFKGFGTLFSINFSMNVFTV